MRKLGISGEKNSEVFSNGENLWNIHEGAISFLYIKKDFFVLFFTRGCFVEVRQMVFTIASHWLRPRYICVCVCSKRSDRAFREILKGRKSWTGPVKERSGSWILLNGFLVGNGNKKKNTSRRFGWLVGWRDEVMLNYVTKKVVEQKFGFSWVLKLCDSVIRLPQI